MSQILLSSCWKSSGRDWLKTDIMTAELSGQCCGGPEAWGRIREASEDQFEQNIEEEA